MIVRMGRLLEPVSNGRARLMIETALQPAGQNPAYSFAAEKNTPFCKTEGGYFLYIGGVFILLYKSPIFTAGGSTDFLKKH
jgi:hypothetical protein